MKRELVSIILVSLTICSVELVGQEVNPLQPTNNPKKKVSATSSSSQNTNDDAEVSQQRFDYNLEWFGVQTQQTIDEREVKQLHFKGARHTSSGLPYFAQTISLSNGTKLNARLTNTSVERLTEAEARLLAEEVLSAEFEVSSFTKRAAGKYQAIVMVTPFRRVGGRVERLVGFDLALNETSSAARGGRSTHSWKSQSVLNNGQWYKVATGEDAIYKVDFNYLSSIGMLGGSIQSDQIRLYGAGAGPLPQENSEERPDDLVQIPVWMEDNGDGSFDKGDYFLFYGEDQITWTLNDDNRFIHNLNPFADSTFYFITTNGDGGEAKRVNARSISQSASYSTSNYDFVDVHEEELNNLIKSGRTWYGEQLGQVESRDFGFNVPNIDRSTNYWVRSRFAARSIGISGVKMAMSMVNQSSVFKQASVDRVSDFYGALYADDGVMTMTGKPISSELIVKMLIERGPNPQAVGWVDFIEINARRQLSFFGNYMLFRDKSSIGEAVTEFEINSAVPIRVWDVSEVGSIEEYNLSGGVSNGYRFKAETEDLREFIAFSESTFRTPSKVGPVQNQNLHALSGIEYLIVVHPSFRPQAERLATLHESLDGLVSAVVTPDQIYNEFSGGAQDVTAIKELMRKLYFQADSSGAAKPKYLLLFGDASYDYKNRITGNTNFVPTHQMRNSLSPTGSIASDDYFGLLDDDEGESENDFVDIGIGRLPARSKKEAEDMVNKIVRYADRAVTFGEWRNKVAFVADDADPSDRHTFMRDFEGLGGLIDRESPEFIVEKLYMDAFKQQVGSGGERYPEGADAVSQRVTKGALMMYYIGHGGELGWGHERILDVATINKWDNLDNLPLFITATCEFARFDDPRRTSGGEYTLLNPSGGGIALLTTTRAVYASPNLTLTTAFTLEAFDRPENDIPRLGDLMLQTKIRTLDTNLSAALNSRSFALLGDPALRLAFPENRIVISEVPDTIKALEKVQIKGMVVNANGTKMQSFNGLVYPSVYDKELVLQTLNNDGVGPYEYTEWKSLIFKGKATVKNGDFTFEFVVPKDIERQMGIGRVSCYANDNSVDANGDYRAFSVGGLSDNPIQDSEGPQIDLFMNNEDFVFGGLTNESPDLYAELRDDNGINMVGSGIGHDITAVLDNNTSNTLILNEFYESDVDSYQSGKVRYPFSELSEGRHSLKMKVWDVNNNPSDAYLEFVVANDEELALEHVLNYPNPFTTNTDFYFEHNKPGQNLDVRIEIFTVAGKLIKTLDGDFGSNGFRVGPINWNGRDEYGDVLAKGVYLYRVAVNTPTGEHVEKFERLVLLR